MAIKIFPITRSIQTMMYTRTQVFAFINDVVLDPEDFVIPLSDEIVTPLEQEPPPEGEPEPDPIYMDDFTAQMLISEEMAWKLFNNPDKASIYFSKSAELEARWGTLSLTFIRTRTYSRYFSIYKDWLYSESLRLGISPDEVQ